MSFPFPSHALVCVGLECIYKNTLKFVVVMWENVQIFMGCKYCSRTLYPALFFYSTIIKLPFWFTSFFIYIFHNTSYTISDTQLITGFRLTFCKMINYCAAMQHKFAKQLIFFLSANLPQTLLIPVSQMSHNFPLGSLDVLVSVFHLQFSWCY